MYVDVKMHFIKKYKVQHHHYSTVFCCFYELCFDKQLLSEK